MTTPDQIIADLKRKILHAEKQGVNVVLTVAEAKRLLQIIPGGEESECQSSS